jgi:hypothetical protein
MRKLAVRMLNRGISTTLVAGLLLAGSLTPPATAATLAWTGTLTVAMSGAAPFIVNETGVATINGSSGLGHLNTLRLPGGFSTTATLPLTDPDIPLLLSLKVAERLASATLALFSGGPPLSQGVMPMTGTAKLCVLFPGCGIATQIPLTVNGTRGIGIGGTITTTTLLYSGTIVLQGAPWTIGVASVITTYGTHTAVGFVHGPASNTSSTAQVGGAVKLVAPTLISTTLGPPIPVLSSLRLEFIPEPGELLLLGTGLALLATLAHRRARG